ncbi:hypothetical protein EHQ91_09595 [Leptospira biflexa]|uniref:hypothetical protein n=1 Tax=Leptospira biflexa TaxID=172 RepID=UPI00109156A7|nr:hypothetical protein [Leptospira biflexa]TGM55184.1 hypothetical protein EHQ91_09595 [Leptospira biflexa]
MKRIRPYFGLTFFFVLYLWNFPQVFQTGDRLGKFDWDLYTFHVEFLRKSYLEFGSFPLWNPYYGAGFPVWENPTSKIGSFTHLFAIFFPSLFALKFSFLFYFGLSGILNFHAFQIYNKTNWVISILFVCLFQFSGYFFQKFYAGHLNQSQGLFLPALIFYFLYLIQNKNYLIFAFTTLITYILLSEGAIYTLTQGAFLIFLLSGREIFISERKKESFVRFIWTSVFLLLVLSFKWVPMFLFVHHVGRYFVPDQFQLNLSDLYSIFFGSSQHPLLSQSLSKMQYRFWEYGNYLGQLLLYCLPLLVVTKRKLWFVLLLLVVTIWIMFGKGNWFSPVTILEQFPIYSWERVYPRWSLSVAFLFVWCLAEVIQTFYDQFREPYKVHFSVFLFLSLTYHTLDVRRMNTKYLPEIFVLNPPILNIQNKETFPITVNSVPNYGSDSQMLPALRNNLSTKDIYENLTFYHHNQSIQNKEYHGEFYLYPSYQKIQPIDWEPDTYTFGPLPKNQLLIFNQKFHPGFVINLSNVKPCSWNGYLAVPLDKDYQSIKLRYSLWISTMTNPKVDWKCEMKFH